MRRFLPVAKLLLLLVGGAALGIAVVTHAFGKPPFLHIGGPAGAGGGGTTSACDGGSSVCALFQNGQSFVTWDDVGTDGAGGANTRYRLYRSTAPINSGNYASATLIASYIFNNSAQLIGGNPNVSGGAGYTQSVRQNAATPMAVLSDLGTPLPTFSGLQVYTALASQDAYYAVVSTTTSDTSPAYIGSVGPIAENVATPQPIKYADSTRSVVGRITGPSAGKAMVFNAHAAVGGGGACGQATSTVGDYYEWFLTTTEGWQDGRAACFQVYQDGIGGTVYSSLSSSGAFVVKNRDTVWSPDGLGFLETYHFDMGLTPNPLVGPANRVYPTTMNGLQRMFSWTIDHYGLDPNNLHWTGTSMGAISGALVPYRMTSPRFSAVWLVYPIWRFDQANTIWWPAVTWSSTMPFKATLGAAPSTLGTNAAAVLMADGTAFGGTGGFADIPSWLNANPGDDMPVAFWTISKDDVNLQKTGTGSFTDDILAVAAFQSSHRGHAFVFNMGHHDMNGMGAIDNDGVTPIAGVAYGKSLFKLNLPYVAFDSSSDNDNMGTGARDANGIPDGDTVGCIECGKKWTVTTDTAGALAFTVDDVWMDLPPTPSPQTTITTSVPSSGSTTATLASAAGFLATTSNNQYFRIGNEIIKGTLAGTTLTISARAQLNTTAAAHSPSDPITQYVSEPTGPNAGPFSTMTTNITPRRLQGFIKPNGTVINCTVTPDGGSPAATSGTVYGTHGVFTLTGITINATGATGVSCS